jgi:GTP cyclohydrolase IB
MAHEKRFMVDAEMRNLPLPLRVMTRVGPEGQVTVGSISVAAHIMQEFEPTWIDRFIQMIHGQRERIAMEMLHDSLPTYLETLQATTVQINIEYPFFAEQVTPISREKCLVRYLCSYTARATAGAGEPKVTFEIAVPVITTYPGSDTKSPGGLFAQLSMVAIAISSPQDVYPEDLIEMANRHALAPVYSYLTEEDRAYIIQKAHTERKTSVVMTDEIRSELARRRDIDWYALRCSNYGMLHPYNTVIGTEKSRWVPFSGYDEEI